MSILLRLVLICGSIISLIFCVSKIKQSKLKIANSVTWMSGSILLILMSIFYEEVTKISMKLGFMAPVNFVFFVMIVFLLVQMFLNSIYITELNEKIKDLNHYIALKEKEEEKNNN